MITKERKARVKKLIDTMKNEQLFEKIEKLVDGEKFYDKNFEIPEHLVPSLLEARDEYKRGEYLTEEEAKKDFEEWLKE